MVPIDTLLKDEERVLDEGIGVLTLTQAVTDLGHNVIPGTKQRLSLNALLTGAAQSWIPL